MFQGPSPFALGLDAAIGETISTMRHACLTQATALAVIRSAMIVDSMPKDKRPNMQRQAADQMAILADVNDNYEMQVIRPCVEKVKQLNASNPQGDHGPAALMALVDASMVFVAEEIERTRKAIEQSAGKQS